jgi:hypothetical protein
MSEKKKSDEPTAGDMVERYVLGIAQSGKCPAPLQPHLTKAAPFLGKGADLVVKLTLLLEELYQQFLVHYEKLRPYRLELLLPGICGLIMCFFGGSFLTLIAAVEAYRMCGYESTMICVNQLIEDFQKVADASKKDDERDDNNDGVKDVQQVAHRDLVKRKALLFLRTINPDRITAALTGINAGFLAVVATLKMKFAMTITLGNAIGGAVEPMAERYVLPVMERIMPADYKHWARPILQYSIRTTAVSVAWCVQRVISAFHSALRGGLMFSRNILEYLSAMGIYHLNHEETCVDELAGYGVALLGLLFQLSRGFSLPFPLNLLLFPFTLIEYFLVWAVHAVA